VELGDTTVLKSSFGAGDLICLPGIGSTCRALTRCILFSPAPVLSPNAAGAQGPHLLAALVSFKGMSLTRKVTQSFMPRSVSRLSRTRTFNNALRGNEGQFSFSGIAAGKYILKVVVPGFEPVTQIVSRPRNRCRASLS
jgi:hypothetical protein